MQLNRGFPTLIATLAVVAGTLGAIGWSWTEPAPAPHVTASTLVTTEFGDEAQGEYLRRHYRRNNGTMLRTAVQYTNGDTGEVKYRPDSTYESFVKVAKDGFVLRSSKYDAAGKLVVDGFEKRDDHTLEWQTVTLADGKLKTVTYWRDGTQPFSVRIRDLRDNTVDMSYFRAGGALWVHQVGAFSGNPTQEDVYYEDGTVQRTTIRNSDGGSKVQFFRPNGTLHFMQHFVVYSDEHHYSISLADTTVYAEDGKSTALKITWGWAPEASTITVYQGDGTRVDNYYYLKREPRGRKVFAADNTVISASDSGADPKLFDRINPAFYAKEAPTAENPLPVWQAAEAK